MIHLLGIRDYMIPRRSWNFIAVAKFMVRYEVVAGAGEDNDLVVAVAGDITEGMGRVAMGLE